jgi:hypothetical protein
LAFQRLPLGCFDPGLAFLPYVGLWISAFFPLALSIAISAGWREPLLTLALYGVLEVIRTMLWNLLFRRDHRNVAARHYRLRSVLDWLWGPIGLLLGWGRYFPSFIIAAFYLPLSRPPRGNKIIRLLTEGRLLEARALLQELAGMQLSIGIVEELILPTLRAIEIARNY